MIEQVGYWGSFMTGMTLLCMSAYGLRTLSPGLSSPTKSQVHYLSWGLVLMVFSVGSNTAYWQVFGQYALHKELLTLDTLRLVGFYLDALFKGSGILGIYLCVKAVKVGRQS